MRDRFIYENHLGQRFDEDCVYLNYSDLRDYSWSCDTINGRISRFYQSIKDRKLPLVIVGKTGDEATEIKNRLFEIAEADIVANIPGKIYSGEYYTQGYITASAKSKYLINKRFSKIVLNLTSDDPAWYCEKTYVFPAGGVDVPEDEPGGDAPSVVPTGTLIITENGTYDVTRYATVKIAVETGAGAISATHDGNGNATLFNATATSDSGGNITLL